MSRVSGQLSSLPPTVRDFLERFSEQARRRFGAEVEEIRLFGSRARGDHKDDSDLDLFVVHRTESREVRRALSGLACDLAGEMELPFWPSTLIMTGKHFQELLKRERRLALDIMAEGIAV